MGRQARKTVEDGFSPRELQVLALMAEGYTLAEAGEELCIGRNTVKEHLARMAGRMSSRNTTHLVTIAIRRGWLVL